MAAFTVKDYQDFLNLLDAHPAWRDELRNRLLADDFLALPRIVRELAEAQKRTEARVQELAEAQKRTEARVQELAEAQKRTEARLDALAVRVEELTEAQKRTETRLEQLATQVHWLVGRVGDLEGSMLEVRYNLRAHAYFGKLVRNVKLVDWTLLEDTVQDFVTPQELEEILNLDLVVRGRWRLTPKEYAPVEVWLAIEISYMVDRNDIQRVAERAVLMRKAGLNVLPIAAGKAYTEDAYNNAGLDGVIIMVDGQIHRLDQAIEHHIHLNA